MRIGIDTGGTFTDVVVVESDRLITFKIPSTPEDPAAAILSALRRAGALSGDAEGGGAALALVHGSTVATNALLEGKTARAALITTEGFEDVLEIGRQARPSLYDIEVQRPRPLIPRDLRFGVPERVTAAGEVRIPLDAEAVRQAAGRAAQAGAESIAVCFLHSYLRPNHEEQAARVLSDCFEGPVTSSSALIKEFREYERFSTAAVNAAVAPVVGSYLGRLVEALPAGTVRIMGSNGGAVSPERATREAVTTVLSGPAAGVVAARNLCAAAGVGKVISFDMGGTSTDVSLIPDRIQLTGETNVSGYPIKTPVIDIHTVGAGGGSIAWVDAGGALKVGPESAGADPGPACYGRGGPATVTDANLLLGRIIPERFVDGEMVLDPEASARSIGKLASNLSLSPEETAAGILEVANVTMARAIRQVSLFRGLDPSEFRLCAFGGAGGLHAAALSEAAGTAGAIVPAAPGVLSAWGLLAGDVIVSRSATVLSASGPEHAGFLNGVFSGLEAEVLSALEAEARLMPVAAPPMIERYVDARYAGQSHELQVSGEAGWIESFHAAHRARFGFDRPEEPVIAVTLRVEGRLPVPPPPPPSPGGSEDRQSTIRPHRVWEGGAWREGRAMERSSIPPEEVLEGPAVITEPGSTIYVPVGGSARVAPDGSLSLGRIA